MSSMKYLYNFFNILFIFLINLNAYSAIKDFDYNFSPFPVDYYLHPFMILGFPVGDTKQIFQKENLDYIKIMNNFFDKIYHSFDLTGADSEFQYEFYKPIIINMINHIAFTETPGVFLFHHSIKIYKQGLNIQEKTVIRDLNIIKSPQIQAVSLQYADQYTFGEASGSVSDLQTIIEAFLTKVLKETIESIKLEN